MDPEVIEPSEILSSPHAQRQEKVSGVCPWTRLVARFLDYSLFCLLILLVKNLSGLQLFKYDHFVPFEFFLWIPVESFLLFSWGTTPGKCFLRTKLEAGRKEKLYFLMALKRSFKVWVRGMGLGISGVNFICLSFAYQRLKLLKTTSWDREDHIQVTHFPIGKWRMYVAVFVALAGLLFYREEKKKETLYAQKSDRSIHEYSSQKISGAREDFLSPNSGCCGGYRG